jgi:tetratricopeptide (TPR) repeat protein
MQQSNVSVWEEKVIIPTYEVGKPDKNPMFFEKRVYQGSSGAVYPNPIIEKIADDKIDKEYIGLFLENRYLKIMILPELGGRIQTAYDKIKNRHFIYHNQVIKPALVGLTGPWISGGIEFNWPQHHRPSTFEPVDYSLEEHADGSKTIWVNEVEKMFHTKCLAGFTLYPDTAYIEIKAKLFNRSPLPQTFLWWANPAVKVNDFYQSVFPSDVNAVFDHGKRDVSSFPIATGTYYKVDYSPGTDISMYKNIPVPTSYMAINSDYDFVGGYEHDTQAGLLHVADHHVSPGKKQWTWGHSDFGQAWDRNLTDEDGPYIELMTGVFTDNQPDFSWLMPYEEKSFTQYFLPYRELGVIKNASKDILLAITQVDDQLNIKVQATSLQVINIRLIMNDTVLLDETVTLSPEIIYNKNLPDKINEKGLLAIIADKDGNELLRYEPSKNKQNDLPSPAIPALRPEEINSAEQLFLTGQHLEQYRHATYSPVPYYEEALKREPTDIRNNNALGKWYLRKGQFIQSLGYLEQAVKTSIQRNPNPYDGEPYFNLGLALRYLGRYDEAYDAFFKSTWNNAWKDTGYFAVAQIDLQRNNFKLALEHVALALSRNVTNGKAYVVKMHALRKLGRAADAISTAVIALDLDKFNLGVLFELYQCYNALGQVDKTKNVINELLKLSRRTPHNLIEYAIDFSELGLYKEAIDLLQFADIDQDNPLVKYYIGYFWSKLDDDALALTYFRKAANAGPDYCFPNRLEDILVLQCAMRLNPSDAKAPYYLGNLFYDKRQYNDAIRFWEQSAQLDGGFPTVLRNLGIAYFNKENNAEKALEYYEKAFALDKTDARILMELDQLYKRINYSPAQRLDLLERNSDVAHQRDDVYLETLTLNNVLGNYNIALDMLKSRQFHPWEGGEGKVSGQYVLSLVVLARNCLNSGKYEQALNYLMDAKNYPHNLGEGKLYGAQENDIDYWLGCTNEHLGEADQSKIYFQLATVGLDEPAAAIFYNDQQPDKIFYQGLAWGKLGEHDKARAIFEKLINYGHAHSNDEIKIDYFAVSLPNLLIFEDDLNLRNRIHCKFMEGLGWLGLNRVDLARKLFQEVLLLEASHSGSKLYLEMADNAANTMTS